MDDTKKAFEDMAPDLIDFVADCLRGLGRELAFLNTGHNRELHVWHVTIYLTDGGWFMFDVRDGETIKKSSIIKAYEKKFGDGHTQVVSENFNNDGWLSRLSWWISETYISPVYTYIGAAIFAAIILWCFWLEITF